MKRNELCSCGSGKKYKHCCLNKPSKSADLSMLLKAFDWLLFPLAIIYLTFEPNFSDGIIIYNESGQYLSVIHEILNGKIIYRDIYLLFGPLSYIIPTFLLSIFGKTLLVLKAYFALSNVLMFILIYAICKFIIKNRWVCYLTTLAIIVHVHHPFWAVRWASLKFASGYAFLLCLVFYANYRKKLLLTLAGVMSALALLQSFAIGFICIAAGTSFMTLIILAKKSITESMSVIKSFLLGFGIIVIPFIGYLILNQALGAFWDEIISIRAKAVWAQPIAFEKRKFITVLFPVVIYLSLITRCIYLHLKRQPFCLEILTITPLVIYGVMAYAFSFRAIQGTQFTSALPLAIMGWGYLSLHLWGHGAKRSTNRYLSRLVFIPFLLLILLLDLMPFQNSYTKFIEYQLNKTILLPLERGYEPLALDSVPLQVDRIRGGAYPRLQTKELTTVLNFVNKYTRQGEPIFTQSDLGFFHFLCDRPSVGRFPMSGHAWAKKEWEAELLNDIKRVRPRVALMHKGLSVLTGSIGGKLEILQTISTYIKRNYTHKGDTHMVSLYLLNE
jgi:hypothetical protein